MTVPAEATDLLERSSRLDCAGVDLVRLHRVSVPLRAPLRASHGIEVHRNSTLVEVRDAAGASGWGECPALTRPTYTPIAAGAWRLLRDELVPAALEGRAGSVRGHPMARFALETTLADLRLRRLGVSLADAIAVATAEDGGVGRRCRVARTVVVGRRIDVESTAPERAESTRPAERADSPGPAERRAGRDGEIDRLLADAAGAVESGARLIKVKVEPGWDRLPLRELRSAFPDIPLATDANGAYAGFAPEALDWVGSLGLAYLEQPLDADDLVGHARLQARLGPTAVALDESLSSLGLLAAALALGSARRFSLKPSRLGGLLGPARAAATTPGCFVGGMFELGVGRAAAVALASLDVIELPSDLGPSSRYVAQDVTDPITLDERGDLIVPDGPGLGVEVHPHWVAATATEVVELRPPPGRRRTG